MELEDEKFTANHISSTDVVILSPKTVASSLSLPVTFSIQEEAVGVVRSDALMKKSVVLLQICRANECLIKAH